MPLKVSFTRLRLIQGGDVHIKAPIALPAEALCGMRVTNGREPKETNAPVSCATCRAVADYCQSRRALRKIVRPRT